MLSSVPTPTAPAPRLPVHQNLGRTPMGIWGSLQAARRNVLNVLPWLAVKQPMISGRTGLRWHMVMDPGAIRRILLEEVEAYPKSNATKSLLRAAIGESMFIAEGAHWRWQRRAAAPVFSHRNVMNLAPVMSRAAENCSARLTTQLENQPTAEVNLYDEMVRTTFDVTADVTFSGQSDVESAQVNRAIDAYIAEAGKLSLFDMLGVPSWVPRPGRFRSGSSIANMRQVADQAIAARREAGASDIPDLLDLLLAGEDPETKRAMNTAELRDNLLTFIVAGHETTALALSWALYLCAFDPEVQERARAEAKSVVSGAAQGADITKLPYIRAIIDEALRLYPPAAIISRTAQKRDMLCDREILPGDTVMVPIYALHRHEMLWQEPDSFRPERFLDQKPDRYAYLPFGDGPRICIGAQFALQEAVIVLATLLARFKFKAIPGNNPEPVMILTLRPEGGVWLEVEPL